MKAIELNFDYTRSNRIMNLFPAIQAYLSLFTEFDIRIKSETPDSTTSFTQPHVIVLSACIQDRTSPPEFPPSPSYPISSTSPISYSPHGTIGGRV